MNCRLSSLGVFVLYEQNNFESFSYLSFDNLIIKYNVKYVVTESSSDKLNTLSGWITTNGTSVSNDEHEFGAREHAPQKLAIANVVRLLAAQYRRTFGPVHQHAMEERSQGLQLEINL